MHVNRYDRKKKSVGEIAITVGLQEATTIQKRPGNRVQKVEKYNKSKEVSGHGIIKIFTWHSHLFRGVGQTLSGFSRKPSHGLTSQQR